MEFKKSEAIRLMEKIIRREFPKVLAREKRAAKQKAKNLKNFQPLVKQLLEMKKSQEEREKNPPSHPWRLCALGSHWVKEHNRKTKSSLTTVDGHCRRNSSKKEILSVDEIQNRYINSIKPETTSYKPVFKSKADLYDNLITGWTQYWNDVFKPTTPLDPNFVKALMASESSFSPKISVPIPGQKGARAHGLMQITDQTIKILNDPKGELKNHIFSFKKSDVYDPGVNISTSIRWLFHKKLMADRRLKRQATWQESLVEYKGYTKQYLKNPQEALKGLHVFQKHYQYLKDNSDR